MCLGARNPPSDCDGRVQPDGTYVVKVKANAEVLLAGIGPEHEDTRDTPQAQRYATLRALSSEALVAEFRAFSKTWLSGSIFLSMAFAPTHPIRDRCPAS